MKNHPPNRRGCGRTKRDTAFKGDLLKRSYLESRKIEEGRGCGRPQLGRRHVAMAARCENRQTLRERKRGGERDGLRVRFASVKSIRHCDEGARCDGAGLAGELFDAYRRFVALADL